MKRKHFTVIY